MSIDRKLLLLSLSVLLLTVAVSASPSDDKDLDRFYSEPYEWGRLAQVRSVLDKQEGIGHFNKTSKFSFEFSGIRTTFNATVQTLDDKPNPC